MNKFSHSWTFPVRMSTLFGLILFAGLLMQFTSGIAETKAKSESSTVILNEAVWSDEMKESESNFDCTGQLPGSFMIGRAHYGDENGITKYGCATATQFGKEVTVTDMLWSAGHSEYDSDYACPTNKVMVGRKHYGDEEEYTWYLCGTLMGPMGALEVAPLPMNDGQSEWDHTFECKNNTALIRRAHSRDETGYTRHACGELY